MLGDWAGWLSCPGMYRVCDTPVYLTEIASLCSQPERARAASGFPDTFRCTFVLVSLHGHEAQRQTLPAPCSSFSFLGENIPFPSLSCFHRPLFSASDGNSGTGLLVSSHELTQPPSRFQRSLPGQHRNNIPRLDFDLCVRWLPPQAARLIQRGPPGGRKALLVTNVS